MRHFILGGLAALAIVGSALPAAAATHQLEIINNSSVPVYYIYTGPSESDDWGDDILNETDILQPGLTATVTINTATDDQCLFDFRLENETDVVNEIRELDICKVGTYTLTDK